MSVALGLRQGCFVKVRSAGFIRLRLPHKRSAVYHPSSSRFRPPRQHYTLSSGRQSDSLLYVPWFAASLRWYFSGRRRWLGKSQIKLIKINKNSYTGTTVWIHQQRVWCYWELRLFRTLSWNVVVIYFKVFVDNRAGGSWVTVTTLKGGRFL